MTTVTVKSVPATLFKASVSLVERNAPDDLPAQIVSRYSNLHTKYRENLEQAHACQKAKEHAAAKFTGVKLTKKGVHTKGDN
jgi:hypothetical protein